MVDAVREMCVRDSSVSNRRARVVYGPNKATRASGPLESELVVRRLRRPPRLPKSVKGLPLGDYVCVALQTPFNAFRRTCSHQAVLALEPLLNLLLLHPSRLPLEFSFPLARRVHRPFSASLYSHVSRRLTLLGLSWHGNRDLHSLLQHVLGHPRAYTPIRDLERTSRSLTGCWIRRRSGHRHLVRRL